MRTILHIDFNSYFATVEQQANPRLRGKPVGVTGGDRFKRTVLGAASVEAKKFGVKTGMRIPEALKLCPRLILVKGDSYKYLESTKRFLNILKDYSPYVEVFSIDEVFLELRNFSWGPVRSQPQKCPRSLPFAAGSFWGAPLPATPAKNYPLSPLETALDIKRRISEEVGEWVKCSIGISYNRRMAKLAGSLYKPDGLVVIADEEGARFILDRVELDEICGIWFAIKKKLNNMGVFSFKDLRKVPLEALLASFKSYGKVLFDLSRGIDETSVLPFYEKEEVKSVGHRYTIDHDTKDLAEIKQVLLKLVELIAKRLRTKKLVGKTVSIWVRNAFKPHLRGEVIAKPVAHLGGEFAHPRGELGGGGFQGAGMQATIAFTDSGMEIFNGAWKSFLKIWDGSEIRMVGVSVSNLKPKNPENLTFLEDKLRIEKLTKIMDEVNNRYGDFTLQRGVLLGSRKVKRMPNPFLADYRFKI